MSRLCEITTCNNQWSKAKPQQLKHSETASKKINLSFLTHFPFPVPLHTSQLTCKIILGSNVTHTFEITKGCLFDYCCTYKRQQDLNVNWVKINHCLNTSTQWSPLWHFHLEYPCHTVRFSICYKTTHLILWLIIRFAEFSQVLGTKE